MNKKISNIVFTKNHPLQLDAYLQSLQKHLPAELIDTYILYKPELFAEQYDDLFKKYSDCIVIYENDFHADLLEIIHQIDTQYILFGIDDVVYFDSIDFEIVDKLFADNDDIFGFSLRLGPDILNTQDEMSDLDINNQKFYKVDWTTGTKPYSQNPFELCATIYKSDLVKMIVDFSMASPAVFKRFLGPNTNIISFLKKFMDHKKILKTFGYFYNPDTFESWNCRWIQQHDVLVPHYLYFQKTIAELRNSD